MSIVRQAEELWQLAHPNVLVTRTTRDGKISKSRERVEEWRTGGEGAEIRFDPEAPDVDRSQFDEICEAAD